MQSNLDRLPEVPLPNQSLLFTGLGLRKCDYEMPVQLGMGVSTKRGMIQKGGSYSAWMREFWETQIPYKLLASPSMHSVSCGLQLYS